MSTFSGQVHIAVVSAATFKNNKEVGITHYLGIDKNYSGQGLGKAMILFICHELRESGFQRVEGETTLRRAKSLGIHFDFGFKPKHRIDNWNTPHKQGALSRLYTRWKYQSFYQNYVRSKPN